MHLYLACSGMMMETYSDELVPRFCHPTPRFAELRSYWELKDFTGHTLPIFGRPFFLDSGAFSAYAKGVTIRVEDYAEFLLRYGSQMEYYANLDWIPRANNWQAKAEAARITLENQLYLESRGLKPIPVFHAFEPWPYLHSYIENYEYICLGGLVADWGIDDFLKDAWGHHLTNPDGSPKVKVHGFGMTTIRHLLSFPWFSVDSQTWLVQSKYGLVAFPPETLHGFDYRTKPILVGVSDNSSMKHEEGKHYDNMTEWQRKSMDKYLAQWNLKISDLRAHPTNRFIANLNYWLEVEKACSTPVKRAVQLELI